MMARLVPVLVRGPSMAPTLRDGDCVLGWRSARTRVGDVVLARFRTRPDLLVVKRVIRAVDDAWWIQGDNEFVADDSRAYGVADVEARVVLRYWPRPRRL
jgi:phage repressor protein C with HTH and peptisase S24 domain